MCQCLCAATWKSQLTSCNPCWEAGHSSERGFAMPASVFWLWYSMELSHPGACQGWPCLTDPSRSVNWPTKSILNYPGGMREQAWSEWSSSYKAGRRDVTVIGDNAYKLMGAHKRPYGRRKNFQEGFLKEADDPELLIEKGTTGKRGQRANYSAWSKMSKKGNKCKEMV